MEIDLVISSCITQRNKIHLFFKETCKQLCCDLSGENEFLFTPQIFCLVQGHPTHLVLTVGEGQHCTKNFSDLNPFNLWNFSMGTHSRQLLFTNADTETDSLLHLPRATQQESSTAHTESHCPALGRVLLITKTCFQIAL